MNNDQYQKTIFNTLRIPARLTSEETALLLGFQTHDIPSLVAAKMLTPLGKPSPNSTKYFAAWTVIKLSEDLPWLNKATSKVGEHWAKKNAQRRNGVTLE